MAARKTILESAQTSVLGALVCAGLGLALLLLPLGSGLIHLSYDLLFRLPLSPRRAPTEVILVYMDDHSFAAMRQVSARNWDLRLHADLVDQLTRDGARVVVFDVVFNLDSSAEERARFAQALRRNQRVILAAGNEVTDRPGFRLGSPQMPWPELLEAARGFGVAAVASTDEGESTTQGGTVRQYYLGNEIKPSLPWSAAKVADAPITRGPEAHEARSWLNYYGPALTLRHIRYDEAALQPAGFFRDRCVFIGARPKTLRAMEEADVFRTPHSLGAGVFGGDFFPGAEIGATAFLNLLRGEGLHDWTDRQQVLLVLLFGLLCGATMPHLRPWAAAGAGVGLVVLVLFLVRAAFQEQAWFAWVIPCFAQVPAAFAWSIRGRFLGLKIEKEAAHRALEETTRLVEATKATAALRPPGTVPDHTLTRLVGRGAYGEVWLARNAIGAYHVVKIIRRRNFPNEEPYEREFRGIQKFMPISRTHPGFVHLLHVGRNDEEQFYYCVMEAADDLVAGQRIDPEIYEPRTLASDIEGRGMITPREGLVLGLALSSALEHLHQQGLIHRDIKPPNILYVSGAPKFADIGLVTEIGPGQVSQVGTEGYVAPEGPGTPGADVYSLGKVLYEAVMGRDRRAFPEVPTAVFEAAETSLLRRLNEVICCACEGDPRRRYRSAQELHEALRRLPGAAGP